MKNSSLVETKSLLAKLMATENITVIHGNVPTASFHLVNRVLRCPVWVDMNGDLYDLLMSHEVGHALHTPMEGWHDALDGVSVKDVQGRIIKVDRQFKTILNVLEDARIEKKIKRKFPGLKSSYVAAYRDLHLKRNFFGVLGLKSFNKLNLIDRINLYTKIGFAVPIKFNDEEMKLVRPIQHLETFAQVVSLAHAIQRYMRLNENDKISNQQDLNQQIKEDKKSGKSEFDQDDSSEDKKSEQKKDDKRDGKKDESKEKKPKEKAEADKSDAENEEADAEEGDGESFEGKSSGEGSDDTDEGIESEEDDESDGEDDESDAGEGSGEFDDSMESEEADAGGDSSFVFAGEGEGGKNEKDDHANQSGPIVSVTDKIFREKEGELVDKNGNTVANVNFPTVDPAYYIIPPEAMVKRFESGFANTKEDEQKGSYQDKSKRLLAMFHQKNLPQVTTLVQQFEIWKNSKQYERESNRKTGDLDTRMLAMYRFTNDIFRRVTEMPKGKNHGLVSFLDMSGSMNGSYMYNAINQIFVLAAFCDRVKIPYDFYGFADTEGTWHLRTGNEFAKENVDTPYIGRNFNLRHLLSSRSDMKTRQRCLQMLAVYAVANGHGNGMDPEMTRLANILGINQSTPHHGLTTAGTPLIETILVSRAIIEEFKKSTRTDIVNVIYLTDGDGSLIQIPGVNMYGRSAANKIIVHDKATHKKRIFENISKLQSEMLAFVRELTGCRHIGYYICSKQEVKSRAERATTNNLLTEEQQKAVEFGYAMIPALGFDRYFYISTDLFQVHDKLMQTDDTEKLTEDFIDIQTRKRYSRLILGQFAKDIADNL